VHECRQRIGAGHDTADTRRDDREPAQLASIAASPWRVAPLLDLSIRRRMMIGSVSLIEPPQ